VGRGGGRGAWRGGGKGGGKGSGGDRNQRSKDSETFGDMASTPREMGGDGRPSRGGGRGGGGRGRGRGEGGKGVPLGVAPTTSV